MTLDQLLAKTGEVIRLAGAHNPLSARRNTEPEEVLSVVAEWDVPTPLLLRGYRYTESRTDRR